MNRIRLDVYSHHVTVTGYNRLGMEALKNFCRTLAQFGMIRTPHGQFQRVMLKVFAAATADRLEYRFHRHLLDDLVMHLEACGVYLKQDIEVVHHKAADGLDVKLKMNEVMVARDYQEPIIEFMTLNAKEKEDKFPKHRRVVTLQTGRGKTFCALKSLSILQKRTVIVIKGMYVKKWISDVEEAFKKHRKAIWKKGDLLVVRGSKNLVDLIELAKAGELTAKVIIITNTTMQNYINDYESSNGTSEMYGCKPQEFYPLLNAGIRLIDEAHQDFHLNFKQDLYTHVPLTLELSATLKPDDKFLDRMYHIMFPVESRYRGGEYVKYISVTAVMYNMKEARRHRHKRRGQYSHVLFEQTMMKDKRRLAAYLDLISRVVHNYFIMKQSPGQKLLVFGATVDFCQILTAHLKNYMSEFSFCCYVSGTDYAKLLESDCTVSTLKSAGTAVDIPGLRTVLMTDSLNSGQANDQALGRLRKLAKWPEVTPEFIYLVCVDIDKHMQYHRRKVEHFTGKVIAHKEVHSGVII